MSTKNSGLPLDGRWHCAPKRSFVETIVLVHHYGGSRATTKKHQNFVAELGYDSVSFSLSKPRLKLRSRWENEIGQILDAIPRPKIVFSFSFPSAPTAGAIAVRGATDIKAWICDGGPFLMPVQCLWNYYTHHEPTKALWLRSARAALGFGAMGMWNIKGDLHAALEKFPQAFPVLNIRSWQDQLVPISAIDQAFATKHKLKLETLTLPEGDHIDGLSRFPLEYKPRVERFLARHSTPLKASNHHSEVSR